ncbi:MAG TPA: ubiquinol-cytochrome c reductase iron-sulfur subunit [Candidatus Saccharimonadales bacterium]|nr:ubiquinol-cytochrome c reductase iron-sulfur subunit [Candidatus Saccharimonadales bacterium]
MSSDDKESRGRVTRRTFCQATGASACAVAAGGAGALTLDFLKPRALFEPPTRFSLGAPDSMEVGAVVTNEQHHVFVIRKSDGFRALSSVCTHLGCITRYQPDAGIIACPCHGSRFDLDGDVIAGPAPRPLHWLEMSVSSKGLITVDTAVEVPQGTDFKL